MNMFSFIEQIIPASKIPEHHKLNLLSFLILDCDMEVRTFKRMFKKSLNEFYQENGSNHGFQQNLEKVIKSGLLIPSTLEPKPETLLYRVIGEVDLDLAASIGLGVAKLENGPYQDGYFFFSSSDNEWEEENAITILLLKIYFQLSYPDEIDDRKLEKYLSDSNHRTYISLFFHCGVEEIWRGLDEIYQNRKCGKIIPFRSDS